MHRSLPRWFKPHDQTIHCLTCKTNNMFLLNRVYFNTQLRLSSTATICFLPSKLFILIGYWHWRVSKWSVKSMADFEFKVTDYVFTIRLKKIGWVCPEQRTIERIFITRTIWFRKHNSTSVVFYNYDENAVITISSCLCSSENSRAQSSGPILPAITKKRWVHKRSATGLRLPGVVLSHWRSSRRTWRQSHVTVLCQVSQSVSTSSH